ncbi:MAG: crotonase/enoyl-CoA hydratase family protein [Candidatus Abyssobacteria bacterium SURF_17]|uniref:Crotonase/enoyl-CoA hydratase family protein n=1 Tax=Candidatus Abyssobacteria bacterium SURF_17 TaxID=2093361 RepID=A0A419F6M4_9BACT|nr:MAG: crotonase/enoyl-CoA hydratase family protein [Candidatus Abyssubacteria bacterium SURF_17]
MSDNSPFKVEKEGFITWLTFNRPEKRNTMGFDFFSGLRELFPRFDNDPEVRVIVIKAEGKTFSAGLDLVEAASWFAESPTADVRENNRRKIIEAQEGMNAIEKCRKPVIAAVHSHCVGAGVDLVSACDIRMASKDAIFSVRETKMALIADLGTLQRLPHIIGHGWFRELALTGRNFSAEEALRIGFITRFCEDKDSLYEQAKQLAAEIAACSPLAVQGTKEVLLYSREHGVYPGLEYAAQKNAAVLPCEDVVEAVQAFMQKRPPEFKGK